MKQGSYGFNLTVTAGFSLVGSTAVRLRIKKPGGTIDRTLSAGDFTVTDAEAGEIAYVIRSGDLDKAGSYSYEVRDETAGRLLISETGTFDVSKPLSDPA